MKILWIFSVLLISSLQYDFKNFHNVNSLFVYEILPEIIRVTKTHDVILVIYDPFGFEKFIFDKVSRTILRICPTRVIYWDPWTFEWYNSSVRGTSRTLIIHLYVSETAPGYLQSKTIVEITRNMILSEHCVKILVITVLKTFNNNLRYFLKHAWTEQLLDVTILEASKLNRSSLTVHQYNPFTKYYSRQPYVPETVWFPNKLDNLHRYPLRVDMISRPAHCFVQRDRNGYPRRYFGPDAHILNIVMQKMNFTMLSYARHTEEIYVRVENGTIVGDLGSVQNGKVDLLATTVPYALSDAHLLLGHTRVVHYERWVVAIPLMYENDNQDIRCLLMANAVNVTLVVIFWLTSVLLRFDRRIWDPIKIIGTMASISMPRLPIKNAERIVFWILLMAASTLFSNVLGALTNIGLQNEREVDFKTFEQLEKANLTPMMNHMVYHLVLAHRNDSLGRLRDRAIVVDNIIECPQYMMIHKNITCFIEESMVSVFHFRNMYKGQPVIKLTKLYFWIPPVGYMLPLNSPYKTLISNIVIHAEMSGIRQKFYTDYFSRLMEKQNVQERPLTKDLHKMRVIHRTLIKVPLLGCSIAFVMFLIEVFIGYGKSILAKRTHQSDAVFVPRVRNTACRHEDNAQTCRKEISEWQRTIR